MSCWSLARFTEIDTSWSLKAKRRGDNKKIDTDLKQCVILPLYNLIEFSKEHNQHDATEDGENTAENLHTCNIQSIRIFLESLTKVPFLNRFLK